MSKSIRIVFMGTPDFAVGILNTLIENNANIVGVITAPDKPAGRGRNLQESVVKKVALQHQIKVLQPNNLKDELFLEELKSLNAELQIVVAFRMLPKVVWQMPKKGTFNLHASLLPNLRGAAPINWAIINQEKETGVTTFFIDQKIDTGAIIAAKSCAIAPRETAGSLHDKLMHLGSKLVLKTVKLIEQDKVKLKIQPQGKIFKEAPKLFAENTQIKWDNEPATIDALIRGLNPYPTAWTYLVQNETQIKVKIFKGNYKLEQHNLKTGAIVVNKKQIWVAVKKGFVEIEELQLPGKKRLTSSQLLNGFTFEADGYFV